MKKFTLLFCVIILFAKILSAQAPAGYYNNAMGQKDQALRTELFNIIKNHSDRGYSALWTLYQTSDTMHRNGKVYVWDMYSTKADRSANYYFTVGSNQCGNYGGEGDCYNREHSVPKSWFNDAAPMVNDGFHLVPTDGYVNGRRSNYDFGEVASATWTSTNGSKLGSAKSGSGSGTVFEPIDEYKGDFARIYFYMATRYMDKCSSWGGGMFGNQKGFETWAIDMLLRWHRADPVSQKEIIRNNAVYKHQNNRNPFVDHPELAEHVWGNQTANAWNGVSTPPADPEPGLSVVPMQVQAGQTKLHSGKIIDLKVNGQALKGNVSLSISGTDASMFVLNNTTISKPANGTLSDVTVRITYTPTTESVHTATLKLTSDEITPIEIPLSGTGVETLTNATDASLMITEYTEGATGNNKALELYNTSNAAIDLEGYVLKSSHDGAGFGADGELYEYALSGTLPAHGFMVLHNEAGADQLSAVTANNPAIKQLIPYTTNRICSFTGNDAIGLFFNDELIDILGVETSSVNNAMLVDKTIRRKKNVTEGSTTFTENEWEIADWTDWSNFGLATPANGGDETSIQDHMFVNINLYPNPVTDMLYVEGESDIKSVVIYNLAGQMITLRNSQNQINVSNLSKGIYAVKITLADGSIVNRKIVKQ